MAERREKEGKVLTAQRELTAVKNKSLESSLNDMTVLAAANRHMYDDVLGDNTRLRGELDEFVQRAMLTGGGAGGA